MAGARESYPHGRYCDEVLEALSPEARVDLARRLAALSAARPEETPAVRHRRRLFLNLLIACCAGLIPWIVLLALTLPRHYEARHWQAAWVGFDVVLLSGLAVTGWAAWRRRQIVILSTLVTGTLLVTDAWFDVLTAGTRDDVLLSLASAVFVELPLALLLFIVARRLIRLTNRSARRLAGNDVLDPPFWKVPLFGIDEPGVAEPAAGHPASGTPALSPPEAGRPTSPRT